MTDSTTLEIPAASGAGGSPGDVLTGILDMPILTPEERAESERLQTEDARRQAVLREIEAEENARTYPSPKTPMPVARLYHSRVWSFEVLDDERKTVGYDNKLVRWRGEYLSWLDGQFTPIADREVRADLYRTLEHATFIVPAHRDRQGNEVPEERVPWNPTLVRVNTVMDALAAAAHIYEVAEPGDWLNPEKIPQELQGAGPFDVIALQDGLLHVPTRRTYLTRPARFTLTALPITQEQVRAVSTGSNGVSPGSPGTYPCNAREDLQKDEDFRENYVVSGYMPGLPGPHPAWSSFLEDLWKDDPASVALLQEWFGYVLSGDTRQEKILLLVGPKRAGKGTIIRVLKALVGARNYAGPTLAAFGQNFGLQDLIGKTLAVVSDARFNVKDQADIVMRLLSISGEDAITVDRKFKEPWTGTLGARLMIVSNDLPRLTDTSGALASRFIIPTRLTRSWYGKEDEALTDKLLDELPGILLWSLDGLDRLRVNRKFTRPKTQENALAELLRLASPIHPFVEECCVLDLGASIPTTILFGYWKAWCEENGSQAGSAATFGERLQAAFPQVQHTRPTDADGKRTYHYAGIRLGDQAQEEQAKRQAKEAKA